jgi:hypothetical protein
MASYHNLPGTVKPGKSSGTLGMPNPAVSTQIVST